MVPSLYISCCHCPLTCHSLSPQSHSLSPGGNWVNRKRMRHAQVGLVPQWTHRSALDVGDAGDFAMQSFLRRKPEAVGGALMTCFSFRSWKQWVIIWSRAEFEGLFSLTNRERQNINYRFRKKTLHKIYKLHSMLLSEINIWSPSKTLLSTWWRNQYLRTSWSSGLHITEEGFWSTPFYRNSKSFKTQNQLPPHIFCNVLPLSILPWRYVLDHCHTGRLLFGVPAEEGRLASKIFMAPKLNVSMLDCMDGVLCVILSISLPANMADQLDAKELDFSSLVSSDNSTSPKPSLTHLDVQWQTYDGPVHVPSWTGGLQEFNPCSCSQWWIKILFQSTACKLICNF